MPAAAGAESEKATPTTNRDIESLATQHHGGGIVSDVDVIWDGTEWVAEDYSGETACPSTAAVSLEEINRMGKGDAALDEKVLARKLGAEESNSEIVDGNSEKREKSKSIAGSEALAIYLEWVPGDESNPVNWPTGRKWRTTLICSTFTMLVAAAGSSYAVGQESMMEQLGSSKTVTILGLSTYPLGFGVMPLILASFSEITGRARMYTVSILLFTVLFVPLALSNNIAGVCVIRFLQGCAGSSGSTLVGGTIADLFDAKDRGLPMSMFSMFAFIGTGVGPAFGGYVAQALDWRWIQWIQGMLAIVMAVALIFFTEETRGSIILSRKAAKLRQETGDERYQVRSDLERTSYATMIRISVTRPLYLLATEAIVFVFSIYAAFIWGILYLALEAVGIIFTEFNFSQGEIGLVFLTIPLAALIGFGFNFYQESLYKKNFPARGPEARLYASCAGGLIFAGGLFILAATSSPDRSHWSGPVIGLLITFIGTFNLYLAVFNYLADSYGLYASSALAGQSLCRNIAGAAFPLFTTPLYEALSVTWASALAAFIALAMSSIPFLLFKYGPRIRARSKFAKAVANLPDTK